MLKAKDFIEMGASYALTPQAQKELANVGKLENLVMLSCICQDGICLPLKSSKVTPLAGVITKNKIKALLKRHSLI